MDKKYFVSMNPTRKEDLYIGKLGWKTKWVFMCENKSEANIIRKRGYLNKCKYITIFKHRMNTPYKTKGDYHIFYYNNRTLPSWYKDFCSCCGRDY